MYSGNLIDELIETVARAEEHTHGAEELRLAGPEPILIHLPVYEAPQVQLLGVA